MARQARNYLAGAVSGTALIVAAVVAFILLVVSFQALRDWPLAALPAIGGEESSQAESAGEPARPPLLATPLPAAVVPAASQSPGQGGSGVEGPSGRRGDGAVAGVDARTRAPAPNVSAPSAPAPAGAPAATPVVGGDGAQASPRPVANPSGGGSNGGGSQGGGGNQGGGGGGAAGGEGSAGGGARSTSEAISSTLNETVGGVDRATGGVVGQTGVPAVAEKVVNGVVGPESAVGKTVDKTVEKVKDVVGGLLGGRR